MNLPFNTRKAIEAAAVILRAHGKKTTRLRLLKLLYLAERKCLRDTGRGMIGGKLTIMRHGPLHSAVYDLIKGVHRDEAQWSERFISDGPLLIRLDSEPKMAALSPYEVETLRELVDFHAQMDDYDLAEYTHGLPEVKGQRPTGDTSVDLPVEEVMQCVCPAQHRDEMIAELKESIAVDAAAK
jgi:uncharacterized phage-associated protein